MLSTIASKFTGKVSRWVTLLVWILLAAVLTFTLPAVTDEVQNNAQNLPDDSASIIADQMLDEYFPNSSGVPALLVWYNAEGLQQSDYELMQKLSLQLTEEPLEAQLGLIPFHQIPLPALQSFASEDGTTVIQPIPFEEQTETEVLKENLATIKEIVNKEAGSDIFEASLDSGLNARVTGPVGISVDATDLFINADIVLLIATVLLVLVLLLLIYRSPILAFIPLIGVGFAYLVTSPILGWFANQGWIVVDSQAVSIMTVLLFGAGTDYCLFIITRYRQELKHERSPFKAIISAFKEASGAIAMSGLTVVIALLTLIVAKYGAFHRFAIPFSLSIFIMGIASLTLVPALLSIFGRGSFYPFIPRTAEMEVERARKRNKPEPKPKQENVIGNKVGRLVVEKPWTVIITTIVLLAGLAFFSTQTKFTYDLLSSFPEDMQSREGFTIIGESFAPGELAPVSVIVKGTEHIDAVKAMLENEEEIYEAGEAVVSEIDGQYVSFEVLLKDNPYSQAAMAYIPQLKEEVATVAGGEQNVWVAGQTASQYDTEQLTNRDNSVIMPLVILLIVILLLAYLRSIVATAYLIGTVLLSYFAALGLGWIILHHMMGFDAIQGAIPLYAFVFLIALGEDYNIFMISSIWKKRKTMPLKQAIREGVSETGGVITSAGLILAATFAVLTQVPIQVLLQFGLITAIGVLMDTFIVRPFMVPAITAVCGKWAFWPSKTTIVQEKETNN